MMEEYHIAGVRYTLEANGYIGARYGNKKCRIIADVFEPQLFDSIGEARRFIELLKMQAAGKITALIRPDTIRLAFKHPISGLMFILCTYRPDFRYMEDGVLITEDFKSPSTAKDSAFILKRKIYDFLYPESPIRLFIG